MKEEALSAYKIQSHLTQSVNEFEGEPSAQITIYNSEDDPINMHAIFEAIQDASSASRGRQFFKVFNIIFFVTWWFPILFFGRVIRNIRHQLSVKENYQKDFIITGPETIWTATSEAFKGSSPMRFFGPRFLAIWVFPFVLTGIVIDVLFVSPLRVGIPFS